MAFFLFKYFLIPIPVIYLIQNLFHAKEKEWCIWQKKSESVF